MHFIQVSKRKITGHSWNKMDLLKSQNPRPNWRGRKSVLTNLFEQLKKVTQVDSGSSKRILVLPGFLGTSFSYNKS